MSFIDVRFPESYAYDAVATNDWRVEIVETLNRKEVRNAPIADPRRSWDLSTTGKTKEQKDGINDYFMSMRGPYHTFPFRDLADYELERAAIALGDGATDSVQLVKSYTVGDETYQRDITKPVVATVRVWVNDVELTSGWDVERLTGLILFDVAPAEDAVIEASCEYDVPVRFAESRLSWRATNRNVGAGLIFVCDSLTLVEVLAESSSPEPQ